MARVIVSVLTAAALLVGCAGVQQDTKTSSSSRAATADQDRARVEQADGKAEGVALLDSWKDELPPLYVTLRDRRRAYEAGDFEKAARAERRVLKTMRPMEKWGGAARTGLVDAPRSRFLKSVIKTGDAYAEWAYKTRMEPPAGDFGKARAIADLAAKAIQEHRRAYRLAGEPIPPALQTR